EALFARIATDDLGPAVPAFGPAVLQKPREQCVRPLAPAEADEGPDRADLVGRVGVPIPRGRAPLDLGGVALEGAEQLLLRQALLLAAGRERNRGRGGVEVGEIGRAGEEAD